MPSSIIYQPYFYIIKHKNTGAYYAGSRSVNSPSQIANPSEFMKKGGYCTSSQTVKQLIKEHGLDSFEIVRIRTFKTKNEAQTYETRFLQKVKAKNNPMFLNKHNNGYSGKHKGSVEKIETRHKKSNFRKGKVTVRDKEGFCFLVERNDPRFLSGELICVMRGVVRKPHSDETKMKMSLSRTGIEAWNKGEVMPRCSCVICKKEISTTKLSKHHLTHKA